MDNFTQLWGQSTGLRLQLFGGCIIEYIGDCNLVAEGETVLFSGLTIGETYNLKVFSADCVECYTAFEVCIKEGGPPNDLPNFSFDYNMENGSPISGTTVNASPDVALGLPACVAPNTPIQDVWYFLNNYDVVNGRIKISNASSHIKSAVYKGDINIPANFEIIAPTCGSGDRFIVLNGMETSQSYWLRVWTENGNEGSFEVYYEDLTATTARVAQPASTNNCTPGASITVDGSNLYAGIPVVYEDDPVLIIFPNGNDLGQITVDFYTTTTQRHDNNNIPYLNRNIAITPENQPMPGNPVVLHFLLTSAELNALGVSLQNLKTTRVNNQSCASAVAETGNTLLSQPYSWANGTYLDGHYFEIHTDHFSSFYAHGGNQALQGVALPVELIDFQGYFQKDKIILNWQTASELNAAWYQIERSADGLKWINIGKVAAQGTSNQEHDYTFTDRSPLPQGYYRLRMEDLDGSFEYSPVISVRKENKDFSLENLFPNPVSEELTLQFFIPEVGEIHLKITDVSGTIRHTERIHSTINFFNKILDVSELESGIYFIEVSMDEKISVHRFAKK